MPIQVLTAVAVLAQRLATLVEDFQAHGVLVGGQRGDHREGQTTDERQDHRKAGRILEGFE